MFAHGLKIKWRHVTEFVPFEFESDSIPRVVETLEWRPQEDTWYEYNAVCTQSRDSNGATIVELDYAPESNDHMKFTDSYWGKSRIVIPAGAVKGIVTWTDTYNNKNNGEAKWSRVDVTLIKPKTRIVTSSIQRQQAKFKAALLACGPVCALTRETTVEALEAAHIIPSAEGGNEVIQNGLLLRADLHKLLDAGEIAIARDGSVFYSDTLSQNYRSLLKDVRLDDKVLRRIAKSLSKMTEVPDSRRR